MGVACRVEVVFRDQSRGWVEARLHLFCQRVGESSNIIPVLALS